MKRAEPGTEPGAGDERVKSAKERTSQQETSAGVYQKISMKQQRASIKSSHYYDWGNKQWKGILK
jgi:hypothetical protein